MATLWIREYRDGVGAGPGRSLPLASEPGVDQSPVTFSANTQSAAFASTTRYITVISDVAFHYVVAANPTATTNALKVPANTLHSIGVPPSQKIAVIAGS